MSKANDFDFSKRSLAYRYCNPSIFGALLGLVIYNGLGLASCGHIQIIQWIKIRLAMYNELGSGSSEIGWTGIKCVIIEKEKNLQMACKLKSLVINSVHKCRSNRRDHLDFQYIYTFQLNFLSGVFVIVNHDVVIMVNHNVNHLYVITRDHV